MPERFVNNPIKTKSWTHTQSKYDNVCKLPCRKLLLAQTNSGKTTLILNMLLDVYRDAWERIVVFSSSWETDSTWEPLKQYMREREWNLDECGFSTYSDTVLSGIIAEQAAIVRWQKAKNHKRLFGLLVIFDDMLSTREAIRGKQIEILYTRGRHFHASVWCSTQAYRRISNVVRMNSDHEFVWRLRNGGDLHAWLEENSAIVGLDKLMEIYTNATSRPYGYLWLKKTATDDNDLFHPNGLNTPGVQITNEVNDDHSSVSRQRHGSDLPEHRAVQHSGQPRGVKQPALRR